MTNTLQSRLIFAFKREADRRSVAGEPRLTKTDIWKAADASSGAATHWFNGANGMDLVTCVKVSRVLRVNPFWLYDESEPIDLNIPGGYHTAATPSSRTDSAPLDPILADLADLLPEDAAVWRAQVHAAAIKVRRARTPAEMSAELQKLVVEVPSKFAESPDFQGDAPRGGTELDAKAKEANALLRAAEARDREPEHAVPARKKKFTETADFTSRPKKKTSSSNKKILAVIAANTTGKRR